MHPFHPHYFTRFHTFGPRRPSRLLWFLIGSGVTAWWIKRHQHHNSELYAHCARKGLVSSPLPHSTTTTHEEWSWSSQPQNIVKAVNSIPSAETQEPSTPAPPPNYKHWNQQEQATPWGFSPAQQQAFNDTQKQWAAETEKVLALGKQAGDTVSDLSEATLDSILTTVEGLKVKLAQHRVQREAEQKRLAEELEKEKNKPVRYV